MTCIWSYPESEFPCGQERGRYQGEGGSAGRLARAAEADSPSTVPWCGHECLLCRWPSGNESLNGKCHVLRGTRPRCFSPTSPAEPAGSHVLPLSSAICRYAACLNKMVYVGFLPKAQAWWHFEALCPQLNPDSRKSSSRAEPLISGGQ